MDTEAAFEKLDKKAADIASFGIEAENFILNANNRHKIVTFAGTKIKVKPALPRAVALKITKLESKAAKKVKSLKGIDPSDVDDETIDALDLTSELLVIAECLSMVCIDKPFNDVEFWNLFEESTGQLSQVYRTIIQAVYDAETEVIEFR